MRATISINDGIIPEGYEAVEFRIPVEGDYIIDNLGGLLRITEQVSVTKPRLILQKSWTWPEWLDANSLAWGGYGWIAVKGTSQWLVRWFMTNHPEPPDRSRVYRNPNRKAGEQ